MKHPFAIAILTLIGFFLPTGLMAKRSAPPKVASILENGTTFSLMTKRIVRKKMQVFATAASGDPEKVRWKTLLYEIRFAPNKEQDVQEVYPKSFLRERRHLEVIDEQGNAYFVTLTGELIPALLMNCYRKVWASWKPEDFKNFQALKKDALGGAHHGLGRWIRNNCELPMRDFSELIHGEPGSMHKDSISSYVIKELWAYFHQP